MAYVKKMLDPFHTKEIPAVGVPDSFSGKSVVFEYEKQLSMSKPAALSAGNWDCHVAVLPLLTQDVNALDVGEFSANRASAIYNTVNGPPLVTGPISVHSCVPGYGTFNCTGGSANSSGTGIAMPEVLNSSVASLAYQGKFRVVGGALKIVNTTAPLEKQGSVTTYRQSTTGTAALCSGTSVDSVPERAQFLLNFFPAPPATLAAAQQLRGTTWDAAEGVLMPIHVRPEEPRTLSAGMQPVFMSETTGTTHTRGYTEDWYVTAAEVALNEACLPFDADICGAYFTGLSDTTTLQITLYLTIEFFPAYNDITNLAIAKAAPEFDPKALECYSHLMSMVPVAARASENAAGGWLKTVGDAVKMVANTVAKTNANVINPLLHSLPVSNPQILALQKASDLALKATKAVENKQSQLAKQQKKSMKAKKK
jgi:hypothetical protein